MSAINQLEAQIREGKGKGVARALRREGRVPAIIYGKGKKEIQISLLEKDLVLTYQKGGFLSHLLEIKTGKETVKVLPRDIDLDPISDRPIHADFMLVSDDAKIRVMVKVVAHNHDKSPGIKRGGILNLVRHEVELLCPANAIPEALHLDLTGLEIGRSIHISAISLPEGATPTIKGRDFTIATIAGRSAEEEVPTTPLAAVAPEAEEGAEGEGAESGEAAKKEGKEE